MSVDIWKIKYLDVSHKALVCDTRVFCEMAMDWFGQDGSDSIFYLPSRSEIETALKDNKNPNENKFLKMVLEFGNDNGWENNYAVGW